MAAELNPPSKSPPAPPPSPVGRPWFHRRGIAIGIAVAAVVVLAAVIAEVEVRSRSGPLGASATGPIPYSTARAIATAAANRSSVSGWNVLAASSLELPGPLAIPLAPLAANATAAFGALGCHLSLPTANESIRIPASNVSADLGLSPAWGLLLDNSTGALLVVAVLAGPASTIVEVAGGRCTALAALVGSVPPSVVDSPKAAESAGTAGGDAFLASHPGALVTMGVVGGVALLLRAPVWNVTYLACGGLGLRSIGTGSAYSVEVSSSTGAVLATWNATLNCSLAVSALTLPGTLPGPLGSLGILGSALAPPRPS